MWLRLSKITLAATLAWVTLSGAIAHATIMTPLDLSALTARADRVVYGTVEKVESKWTSGHEAIYTDVTLRVQRAYKGAVKPGDSVVVRREGGTVGGIGMRVFGSASFAVGEEVVVFVEQRGAASWVVGMAQGKLRVTTLPTGQKQVTAPELTGIAFVDGQAPPRVQPRALDELERQVRALVQSGAK
jgi:hypothetical protein